MSIGRRWGTRIAVGGLVVAIALFALLASGGADLGGRQAPAEEPLEASSVSEIPPGPPGPPVSDAGTPEDMGDEAESPSVDGAQPFTFAEDLLECHAHDTRYLETPDYAPPPLNAAVAPASTNAETDVPPPTLSPTAAIADYLASPSAPPIQAAALTQLSASGNFATYQAKTRDPLTGQQVRWAAINLRRLSSGDWQVIHLAACGEYINPESSLHTK